MARSLPSDVDVWRTHKGLHCHMNGDAGGVFLSAHHVVAVLVDEINPTEARFSLAKHWVRAVVQTAQGLGAQLDPDSLVQGLKEEQGRLRSTGFLHQRAVYAVLVLEREGRRGWALHCGDCRVGSLRPGQKELWHTNVHTMANVLGEMFTEEHALRQERHVVTRCLNARRFVLPELTFLPEGCDRWVLATDGYWIDHLIRQIPIEELPDDASLLSLDLSATEWDTVRGAHNFLVRRA